MSTYFYLRVINLAPDVEHRFDNRVIGEQLAGNYLVSFLHEEYQHLSMYRGVEGERETCGSVSDSINAEHGEPPTTRGSLANHRHLLDFLERTIFDHAFADRLPSHQRHIRELRAITQLAYQLQEAMCEVSAPVIFTVSWS